MVKLQDWLEKYIHQDYAYLIVDGLVTFIVTLLVFIAGYIFDFIPFAIISLILTNKIRNYSSGFHLHTTFKCAIFTTVVMIIFGYISRMSTSHLWALFLLYGYCVRDLYLRAPISLSDIELRCRWYNTRPFIYIWKWLKIDTTKYDIPYDLVWYRKGMIRWLVISLFFSVILLCLKLYYLTGCVLLSVMVCDLLLFLNQDEFL